MFFLYIFQSPSEVTYAELCISRPGTIGDVKTKSSIVSCSSQHQQHQLPLRRDNTRQDQTIYAVIDHNRRPPLPSSGSGSVAAAAACNDSNTIKSPLTPTTSLTPGSTKEIVTVRTPLMGHQQESCV